MATLWAQQKLYESTDFWLWTVILCGTLLLGALVISWIDRWRKQTAKAEVPSAADQLASYRVLYERGELSQEEYNRIHSRLANQIRRELLPGKPAPEVKPPRLAQPPDQPPPPTEAPPPAGS
jgi:hypothetical protein